MGYDAIRPVTNCKSDLEAWAAAVRAYDEGDFEKALYLFSYNHKSAKMWTNMGLIYAATGEHQCAVTCYIEATKLDRYLAIGFFQCGVSNFLLGRYELAARDFEQAFIPLRGDQQINYEQLGLDFTLYPAEVLFNMGLSQINLGRVRGDKRLVKEGIKNLEDASKRKVPSVLEHSFVDHVIRSRATECTIFTIPVGVLYRPPEKLMRSLRQSRDFIVKSIVVATADTPPTYILKSKRSKTDTMITPHPRGERLFHLPGWEIRNSAPVITPALASAAAASKSTAYEHLELNYFLEGDNTIPTRPRRSRSRPNLSIDLPKVPMNFEVSSTPSGDRRQKCGGEQRRSPASAHRSPRSRPSLKQSRSQYERPLPKLPLTSPPIPRHPGYEISKGGAEARLMAKRRTALIGKGGPMGHGAGMVFTLKSPAEDESELIRRGWF